MHQSQREQTHALLQARRIDQALFARPESIKWLTGFAPPPQVGVPGAEASYPLVWYEDGHFTLIVLSSYAETAGFFARESDCQLVTYVGRTLDRPVDAGAELLNAFRSTAKITPASRIGIEQVFTSALIASAIPTTSITPIDGWLEPLRMIKTPEELATLRRNFALTDLGHAAAKKAVAPGVREIDVWNTAHSAIQAAAGCRIPLGNDCIVGYRSFNEGGWPQANALHPGDSIIVDLSVVWDGYWSDSCATYYATERTPQQEKIHRVITDALAYGISLVRPGAVAHEIDQKIRQFITDAGYAVYGHHTGHGVGVSGHEAPRIVACNDQVLQPGMVIMLEPGIYFPGQTGVRLEDGMLVTADGCEILTHHDKS